MPSILVVNHVQHFLDILRDLLEAAGYQTHVLVNTTTPLSAGSIIPQDVIIASVVEQVPTDVVLLDIPFGEENVGWQLVQELRLQPTTSTIPMVVTCAASAYARELQPQLRAHHVHLVCKPFSAIELVQTVQQVLSRTAVARQAFGLAVSQTGAPRPQRQTSPPQRQSQQLPDGVAPPQRMRRATAPPQRTSPITGERPAG